MKKIYIHMWYKKFIHKWHIEYLRFNDKKSLNDIIFDDHILIYYYSESSHIK